MKRFLLLIVIIFSFTNISNTKASARVDSIEDILSYSNSSIVKKEVFGYGHFSSKKNNREILNEFLSNKLHKLNFSTNETNNSVSSEYISKEFSYTITIANSKNYASEKFISIFYSHNVTDMNIISLRETIRQMLVTFDNNPKVSSHIISKINGKLTNKEISSTISYMLNSSGVRFHKDYEDTSVSFSGYSPLLSNTLNIDGEDINVQASGKYSSVENATYIWVGNPIISTEY